MESTACMLQTALYSSMLLLNTTSVNTNSRRLPLKYINSPVLSQKAAIFIGWVYLGCAISLYFYYVDDLSVYNLTFM